MFGQGNWYYIPGFPQVGSGAGMAMALTAAAKAMMERYFMVIEVVNRGSVEGVWIVCFE